MPVRWWMLYVSLLPGAEYVAAQEASQHAAPSAACVEFNKAVLQQLSNGRLAEAETALSDVQARPKDVEQACAWLVLHNMAMVAAPIRPIGGGRSSGGAISQGPGEDLPARRPRLFPPATHAVDPSIRTAEDRKGPGGVSTIADGS